MPRGAETGLLGLSCDTQSSRDRCSYLFFWCLPMARIDQMATRSVCSHCEGFITVVEVSTSSIIGLISYPDAPLVTDSQAHRLTGRRLRPLRCRPFADPSSNPYNNNPLGTDFVDSPLVTQRMGACPYSRLANQRIFRARDLVRIQMVHANWWLPSSIAGAIK